MSLQNTALDLHSLESANVSTWIISRQVCRWHSMLCHYKGKCLLQARADFDFFGEGGEDRLAFRAYTGGYDHAVGFDSTELARREVHHHHHLAADQRLRFVILRDASANLAHFAADIDSQLQQLVRADDALGRLDLAHAHLHFREIFNRDLFWRSLRGRSRSACWRSTGTRRWRCNYRLLWFAFHRFHPLDSFLFFDSRKQCFRFRDLSSGPQRSPLQFVDSLLSDRPALPKGAPESLRGSRNHRMRQHRDRAQSVRGDPQHCFQVRALGRVLRERPRLLLRNQQI